MPLFSFFGSLHPFDVMFLMVSCVCACCISLLTLLLLQLEDTVNDLKKELKRTADKLSSEKDTKLRVADDAKRGADMQVSEVIPSFTLSCTIFIFPAAALRLCWLVPGLACFALLAFAYTSWPGLALSALASWLQSIEGTSCTYDLLPCFLVCFPIRLLDCRLCI